MRHMRRVRTMACVVVAVTLLVNLLGGSAFAATADSRRKIVILDNPLTQEVFTLLAAAGITVLYSLSLINALAVQLPPLPPIGPDSALALLEDLGEVYDDVLTFIDPICPTTAPPSLQEYRWGMQQIEAEAAHQQWPNPSQTGAVTVAVLDTGIQSHLVDLGGKIAQGYNAITDAMGQPPDAHGHGTHMAGIILAASNGVGVVGVAGVEPKIQVAAVKVLDDTGAAYLSVVINGLQWVRNNGIRLVNMSFGFSFSMERDGNPLRRAIQMLFNAGIIMVASAGNTCCAGGVCGEGGGEDCGPAATCNIPVTAITAPAAYQGVLAVGATAFNGQTAAYSLSGPQLAVVAHGGSKATGRILSTTKGTCPGGCYGWGSGTGQAAAHVSGAVALALQREPGLSLTQVKNLLQATARDQDGSMFLSF
jgi:subtilisin family serine protease